MEQIKLNQRYKDRLIKARQILLSKDENIQLDTDKLKIINKELNIIDDNEKKFIHAIQQRMAIIESYKCEKNSCSLM